MRFLSILDVEMAVKRGLYNFFNSAKGKPLIWDAGTRKYVAHVEPNQPAPRGNPFGPDGTSEAALADWRQRRR